MQVQRRYNKPPITEAVIDLRVTLPEGFTVDKLNAIHSSISKNFPTIEPFYKGVGAISYQPGEAFLLNQVAIRTLKGFSFDAQGSSLSLQNKEFARKELSSTLAEIYDLLTWPEAWNGYDACAPKYEAIQYAEHWIELFYLEIMNLRLDWLEPNVTASAEGEVVFEWRHGINRLTVYLGNQRAEYVKDWGADINTDMEDGYANSPGIRKALWKWLMN